MQNPLSFRFRGRQQRLLMLYKLFKAEPNRGLHPSQIARGSGMSIMDADERLRATPEMFVRIPRRPDGITRYRLTSTINAMDEAQVRATLQQWARRETLVLYAVTAVVILSLAIVLLLIGPVV